MGYGSSPQKIIAFLRLVRSFSCPTRRDKEEQPVLEMYHSGKGPHHTTGVLTGLSFGEILEIARDKSLRLLGRLEDEPDVLQSWHAVGSGMSYRR